MRIHCLGLPHTQTLPAFSHCAYTGKVLKFGPMMAPLGYELIHYGVGSVCPDGYAAHVEVMTTDQQAHILGRRYDPDSPTFVGNAANVDSPLYQVFNRDLRAALQAQVQPEDWIALPFGHGHLAAVVPWLDQCVETGIGYPTCVSKYRIYESHCYWMWHMAHERREPWITEWVVPNFFVADEWPLRTERGSTVLYLGRLNADKGLNILWQLAQARPDLRFVICGQGDPSPWLTVPNIEYRPPVQGIERAALMHEAFAVLTPSQYVEPFGGVAVEAMLTGTPVLASPVGAFAETIAPFAGRHCRTLGDWLAGLEWAEAQDADAWHRIHLRARSRYSLEAVGPMYDDIFRGLPAIARDGWHARPLEVAV